MVLVARQESLHDLVQRLPIAAFNEDAEGSTNRGSSTWNAVTKTECALCGEKSEEKLTRARIVSDQTKANTFGLPYDNERNMLFLCGTKDQAEGTPREEWSCHALFDRRQVGLVHDPSDKTMTKFRVVGGPNHMRVATCTTKPSRTSLHAHLARSMWLRSLWIPVIDSETTAKVATWLSNVSPTNPEAEQAAPQWPPHKGGKGPVLPQPHPTQKGEGKGKSRPRVCSLAREKEAPPLNSRRSVLTSRPEKRQKPRGREHHRHLLLWQLLATARSLFPNFSAKHLALPPRPIPNDLQLCEKREKSKAKLIFSRARHFFCGFVTGGCRTNRGKLTPGQVSEGRRVCSPEKHEKTHPTRTYNA